METNSLEDFRLDELEAPETFNICEYLIDECNIKTQCGDRIAMYTENYNYTYNEVARKVNQYGNYIKSLGLESENKIGILYGDSAEFVFMFLGAIRVGVVPIVLNTRFSLDDIKYIIHSSHLKFLFTTQEFKDKLLDKNYKYLKDIVILGDLKDDIASMLTDCEAERTNRDDIAFWVFTSGSSGRPKGVMHYQHSLYVQIKSHAKYVLNLNQDDIIYTQARMSFAMGLGIKIGFAFGFSAAVVITEHTDIISIVEDIKKYKPTFFNAVPTIYKMILQLDILDKEDIVNLKQCCTGGEKLPEDTFNMWKEKYGHMILTGFGSSEMLLSMLSESMENHKVGSVGVVNPGFEAYILDCNGMRVEDGNVGELYVSGGSIMAGYWNNAKDTEKVKFGSGYKTGDNFYRDKDGFFFYVGRETDSFKVNGVWVNGLKIETVILANSKIKQAVVTGETSKDDITKIVAYLVVSNDFSENDIEDIKNDIRKKLRRDYCPKRFCLVNKIPIGATGKISRKDLATTPVIKVF